MKKRTLLILFCFIIAMFESFGQTVSRIYKLDIVSTPINKSISTFKKIPPLTCDYFVDTKIAQDMISEYAKRYIMEGLPTQVFGLTKEFFLDKCVFLALNKFFSDNPDFDGVRFFMGTSGNSELIIVPTSPVSPPSSSFKHTNRWDVKIGIDDVCSYSSLININLKANAALKKINDFGTLFRKETYYGDRNSANIDALSSAIWMDKCVIEMLTKKLNDNQLGLDGIMAYPAAYLGEPVNSNLGQKYPYQSTLIFVPTAMVGNVHRPRWEVIDKSPVKLTESNSPRFGAANHSQLCPQICD